MWHFIRDFIFFISHISDISHFLSVLQIILSRIHSGRFSKIWSKKYEVIFQIQISKESDSTINIHPDTSSYQFQPITDFYWQFESYFTYFVKKKWS